MTIENIETVNAPKKPRNSRMSALYVGGFLALVVLSVQTLLRITGGIISTAMPYVAGVGMFAALMVIFAVIIGTLMKMRRSAKKNLAMWDCFVAVSVIGTAGYFQAACVQTFQPGGHPADFWTLGAMATGCFALLFGGGKYAAEMFAAGKSGR